MCSKDALLYDFFYFGHFIHKYNKKEISKGNQEISLLLSIVLYGIVVWLGKVNGDTGFVVGIVGAISRCFIAYYIAIRINGNKIIGKY